VAFPHPEKVRGQQQQQCVILGWGSSAWHLGGISISSARQLCGGGSSISSSCSRGL
jgi:hypothetical protein